MTGAVLEAGSSVWNLPAQAYRDAVVYTPLVQVRLARNYTVVSATLAVLAALSAQEGYVAVVQVAVKDAFAGVIVMAEAAPVGAAM